MDSKQIAAYVGAGIAIALGVALLYVPPAVLSGEASTVGWAASFITGGLAAIGVTVAVPAVRAEARRSALVDETERRRVRRAARSEHRPAS